MDTITTIPSILDIGKDAIRRSFEISPETIFGVLVGLLVISVIYLTWRTQKLSNKLIELNMSTTSVLKDISNALGNFNQMRELIMDNLNQNINSTREHILDQIRQILKDHGTEDTKRS